MRLGLVAGEELRRRAPSRLLLKIDVGERLPGIVADDEAGILLVDRPGPALSQQASARVILEDLGVANVSPAACPCSCAATGRPS